MKIQKITIHNFRSVRHISLKGEEYMLLIGANNAGKSTIINALRAFYDDCKWSSEDFPKGETDDQEAWVEISFRLSQEEWESLADKYKEGVDGNILTVRRYFKSATRVKSGQSNIYGIVNGEPEADLFYGAKQVGVAKVGEVVYVPALTTTADQTKMSGPSPLRNMLNFLLKKVVAKSEAYGKLTEAFKALDAEAKSDGGFLQQVSQPLNSAISGWNISLNLSVNTMPPEDISKNLVSFGFVDGHLGDSVLDLDRYGHGFQRSVIYELIKLAPTFVEDKKSEKKEFNPSFTLVLFEEPEAFLHPAQQEVMAYHLRRLASVPDQQIFVTSHSSIFAGKAAANLSQIVRVRRTNGVTEAFQPDEASIAALFQQGGLLLAELTAFVANGAVPENQKSRARRMIANPPAADIALQEEQFRFQLWLDGERSSVFFADRVLLVEGATERALFNYLVAGDWHDLAAHRVCVVDVLGKFNFHRFIGLLKAYGIPFGVMLDDDNDHEHHQVINDLVAALCVDALAPPEKFAHCLETYLGLPVNGDRSDKKPIEMMKAATGGQINVANLAALKEAYRRALAL